MTQCKINPNLNRQNNLRLLRGNSIHHDPSLSPPVHSSPSPLILPFLPPHPSSSFISFLPTPPHPFFHSSSFPSTRLFFLSFLRIPPQPFSHSSLNPSHPYFHSSPSFFIIPLFIRPSLVFLFTLPFILSSSNIPSFFHSVLKGLYVVLIGTVLGDNFKTFFTTLG